MHRLRQSYEAIPAGAPVRLAKRTSNLFRPRADVTTPGLDVSGLRGVVALDPRARTADVQGMCTYEDLVDVTLAHGLMPLVVPQLRTITLGGAVTGLGIESTSFRNGLPHESVLEMDVLTGAGDLVTATRDGDHADLFATFLQLLRQPRLRHPAADRARAGLPVRRPPARALRRPRRARQGRRRDRRRPVLGGHRIDAVDGVVFEPGEAYLTLATWTHDPGGRPRATTPVRTSTTGRCSGATDLLTCRDYLWRWDTDWFWCSRAFGAQDPRVRRLWPRRYRRSDVYHRLVGLENRLGLVARVDRWRGRPARERVIQDVEVPVENLPAFLRWFDDAVGMRPVWLCPLRLREAGGARERDGVAVVPAAARHHLRQRRLLGDGADRPGRAGRRRQPRGGGA